MRMLGMESFVLSKSAALYVKNTKGALGFAILLVAIILFMQFPGVFVSSGTIFFYYAFLGQDVFSLLLFGASVAVFLLAYSFFITVLTFSVRKELSSVKLNYYITEAIRRFSFKLFRFFVALSLALYFLMVVFSSLALPMAFSLFILLLTNIMLLFVPQAIVVDEVSVRSGILSNLEFVLSHPRHVLFVLVLEVLLLSLLSVVEFALDHVFLAGNYVSVIAILVFVVPFTEIVKTYLYMVEKFELIGQHEKQSH